MPLSSGMISNNILAQFNAKRLTGKNNRDITNGLGMAVYMFLTTPNLVSCSMSGTVGPVGNLMSITTLGVVPNAMSSLMNAQAKKNKLTGRNMPDICSAAATGIATSMASLMLSGTTAGLAVGAGTGSFSKASDKIMANILYSQEMSKFMRGRNIRDIVNSLASGFVSHIKNSAKITLTATGAIAPVAPAGPVATSSIPAVFSKIS